MARDILRNHSNTNNNRDNKPETRLPPLAMRTDMVATSSNGSNNSSRSSRRNNSHHNSLFSSNNRPSNNKLRCNQTFSIQPPRPQ